MKTSNVGYINITTEHQLLPIAVVPTGKVKDDKAEGIVITPKVGVDRVWFSREQICQRG